MARSTRPRKKYRPKVARNPVAAFEALNRSHVTASVLRDFHVVLDADQQRDIAISYAISLDRMSKGTGNEQDLGNLGFMCNVALVLCERGFGVEYQDEVVLAQHALWRANQRKQAGKTLAFDAVVLQAIRRAFALHSAQVETAGQGQLVAAGAEVARRQDVGDVFRDEPVERVAA